MLYDEGMTTTTTDDPIEGMRLYVDAIDSKPQNFDWSENPNEEWGDSEDGHGTPWSFTEYRDPEEGDEAGCDGCSGTIVFDQGEWHHTEGTCDWCSETVERDRPEGSMADWGARVETGLDFGCAENPESDDEGVGGHEVDFDHDAEPDSEYTQDPDYVTGPMMNYWYPVEIRDVESAARKLAGLPVCVVTVDGETGLALTGGGMDLSWQICEAFIRIGSYPPFHFVSQLPRMADRWSDRHELVLAAGRKVIEIQRSWAESAAERLEGTASWMKNREWEADNARRAAARGDQS